FRDSPVLPGCVKVPRDHRQRAFRVLSLSVIVQAEKVVLVHSSAVVASSIESRDWDEVELIPANGPEFVVEILQNPVVEPDVLRPSPRAPGWRERFLKLLFLEEIEKPPQHTNAPGGCPETLFPGDTSVKEGHVLHVLSGQPDSAFPEATQPL